MNNFFPHSVCLRNNPTLIAMNVISDIIIAVAYLVIPAALILISLRLNASRKYSQWMLGKSRTVLYSIAAFIVSCGAGHLLNAATYYVPMYWPEAWWKVLTAVISTTTTFLILLLALGDDDDTTNP